MICNSLAEFVEQDNIVVCGSVLSFVLRHPVLGDLFFVTAHLDATTSRKAYAQSISNLDYVISQCPSEAALCCGIDASANLFGLDSEEALLGPYCGSTPRHMAWKARLFAELETICRAAANKRAGAELEAEAAFMAFMVSAG